MCSLYQNTHHLCVPPLWLFGGFIWAGYCIQMVSVVYFLQRLCFPPGSTCLLQEQMNIRVQPILSTNPSAQQTGLWKHSYDTSTQHLKHPIQPAINCHFRHLWQTVNTCLSENNYTLWAQPMEQHFLSNQRLIREPNKNKGYTIWPPPLYLCSIKTHDFN